MMSTANPAVPVLAIDAVISQIDAIYENAVKPTVSLFKPVPDRMFDPIETAVDSFLHARVNQITDDTTRATIVKRIRERRSSLSTSSDIATEIIGICKQVLAFGAAGFGLSIGFADKIQALQPILQKTIAIGGVVYLELTASSLLVLIWHVMQARFRYPFLDLEKIGNTWAWFYYASISPQVSRAPIQLAPARAKAATLYAKDLAIFGERSLSESSSEELRNELQQYFLLLSYQGYVNQFSLRITNLFFYGFSASILTGLILALWAILV